MTRRLRIISFLAALGCFGLSAGLYQLGLELWPPKVARKLVTNLSTSSGET